MKMKKDRMGFTLVELLMVVGIVSILSASGVGLYTRLVDHHDYTVEKINGMEDEQRILRFWREDVALAQRVEISPDGAGLIVFRTTPAAEVHYTCTHATLTRNLGGTSQTLLSTNVNAVRFEKTGRAMRITWNSLYTDGVRTTITPHSAIATPLTSVAAKESVR